MALAVILVVLVLARIALPFVMRAGINRRLDRIRGYTGHVSSVSVDLYRGAYRLQDVEIVKRNGQVREPFLVAREIDFSVAWRELLHGRVVSDIYAQHVALNFVKGPTSEETQIAADRRWQDAIGDIFPINITFVRIDDGTLRFLDQSLNPPAFVHLAHLTVVATGLRNRISDTGESFPARIAVEGETIGGGKLKIVTQAEPLADKPHFYLKLQLEGVSLAAMNELLRSYLGVDTSAGTFNGYLEIAAANGRATGYFKPFFEHVEFKDLSGERPSVGQQIKQGFVELIAKIFRNRSRDSVATRIPFSGRLDRLNYDAWQTFVNMLRHGFTRGLKEKLDSSPARNTGEIARPIPPKSEETSTAPTPVNPAGKQK